MRKITSLFTAFLPMFLSAQGFYGAYMFTQNFADCDSLGGALGIHLDNDGVYGSVMMTAILDGDTIAETNSVTLDTVIPSFPGEHFFIVFFEDAAGGPGSNQDLIVSSSGSLLMISCNTYIAKNTLESFNVFPNPATDNVTLQIDQQIHQGEIYDMTGRMAQTIQPTSKTINVSQLAPGQYVIKVRSDKFFTSRFYKE